ncbi:hypothetical protein LzC2_34530 [Planctomycetes bacterium LzC2]|uniref:TadE-like domain-containing protein n=1 Tax=Alienimonas chondri TaxID=2681879 RepID=A0ABX1VIT1_9PLAN|nr:hypothetical protein [Alienimonas chondri]
MTEFAVCLPLFGLFLAAILEINHASMTAATMRAAAEKAGRMGVMDGVTTAEVETLARETAGAAVPNGNIRVHVKNAAAFDSGGDPSEIAVDSLPDIEVADARPRQLFVVRVEVTYADVSLIPPFLLKGPDGGPKVIYGQAVNRHE